MKRFATTPKTLDAQIRDLYGWTQEQVASYLGIGRSLYSLCESGDRKLPSLASLAWLEWIKFSYGNDNSKNARAALALPPPGTQKLLRQADDCEWEAQKLQRKSNSYAKTLRPVNEQYSPLPPPAQHYPRYKNKRTST